MGKVHGKRTNRYGKSPVKKDKQVWEKSTEKGQTGMGKVQ